jgi:hypothetical protein
MKASQKLAALAERELPKLLDHVIVADGEKYRVFGSYVLRQTTQGYSLTYQDNPVGTFTSTRSAMAWCIADKNHGYNTAREILRTDNKLTALKNDIHTRAAIGDRSRDPNLREIILTKLESKIIQKKMLENQLNKYVNWAKQTQSRKFISENNKK